MASPVSVGDAIAVGKLIKDIVGALQSVGGAKSEYQELVRELQSLDTALRHLDKLQSRSSNPEKVQSIKCAALSCRYPLENFLARIHKYEASLGPWTGAHIGKATKDKLRWNFGEKDEIRRLHSYLNVHIGTINMLLVEHGLERMDLHESKTEENALEVRNSLNSAHVTLDVIKNGATGQTAMLGTMQSLLGSLCGIVSGEISSTLQQLSQLVNVVCVSTQQIHTVVLEIHASLTTVDTRWTHFQNPYRLEDALGVIHAIPSEISFEELESMICAKFRVGPLAIDVGVGNYELCRTKNKSKIITATTYSKLRPGTEISMAIMLSTSPDGQNVCPLPRCRSPRVGEDPGGGFICLDCEVWFDQATRPRNYVEGLPTYCTVTTVRNFPSKNRICLTGEEMPRFKNVRWSPDLPHQSLRIGGSTVKKIGRYWRSLQRRD